MAVYNLGYTGAQLEEAIARVLSGYIFPSGTKSITENGTGIDVKSYKYVDVDVEQGMLKYNSGDFIDNNANKYINDFNVSVGFKPRVFVIHADAGVPHSADHPVLASILVCNASYSIIAKYTVYLNLYNGVIMGSRSDAVANTLKLTSNGVAGNSGTKSLLFLKAHNYKWYAWG